MRRPRGDDEGSWHHVINRGLARRPIFECEADKRGFLALVAIAVRRGWIEVHAYALLTNHFHLLLRSPSGKLSFAVAWIENNYTRWFNRRRKRDGPLFRGRFPFSRIRSRTHWCNVVRYIDANAVAAGLAPDPCSYPMCSAWHYARAGGPPWLERSEVEALVKELAGSSTYAPESYARVFLERVPPPSGWWIRRRLSVAATEDPLDDLIAAAPAKVRRWLLAAIELADGRRAERLPMAEPRAVVHAVAACPDRLPPPLDARVPTARQLTIGLLRQLCGIGSDQAARRLRLTDGAARRAWTGHCRRIREEPAYADIAAELTASVLRREM